VNTRLGENETELGVLILPVPLEVLTDGDSLLDTITSQHSLVKCKDLSSMLVVRRQRGLQSDSVDTSLEFTAFSGRGRGLPGLTACTGLREFPVQACNDISPLALTNWRHILKRSAVLTPASRKRTVSLIENVDDFFCRRHFQLQGLFALVTTEFPVCTFSIVLRHGSIVPVALQNSQNLVSSDNLIPSATMCRSLPEA
jgi:hypothetical protein